MADLPDGTSKFKSPYMAVGCPTCGATVGHWCKRPSGHSGPMVAFHAARRLLYADSALKPGHPRWREFIDRLAGPEGCDFREKEGGGDYTWKCYNGHELAREILEKMGGIDVEATLGYCREHGGHCDCEIVFNVDGEDWEPV